MARAEAWLDRMKRAKVTLSFQTFQHLIVGYGRAGDVVNAEDVLSRRMRESAVAPHPSCYLAMLTAHAASGDPLIYGESTHLLVADTHSIAAQLFCRACPPPSIVSQIACRQEQSAQDIF